MDPVVDDYRRSITMTPIDVGDSGEVAVEYCKAVLVLAARAQLDATIARDALSPGEMLGTSYLVPVNRDTRARTGRRTERAVRSIRLQGDRSKGVSCLGTGCHRDLHDNLARGSFVEREPKRSKHRRMGYLARIAAVSVDTDHHSERFRSDPLSEGCCIDPKVVAATHSGAATRRQKG
jgi:hypothetical protein